MLEKKTMIHDTENMFHWCYRKQHSR